MAHRFRTIAKGSSAARGYGIEHVRARKAAAARHQAMDPCVRCGRPLGPMGSWLHYDHNDDRTGYLGFAHARCNRREGARQGRRAQVLRASRTPRPKVTPLDLGIRNELPEFGTCVVCDATFSYSHDAQRTCGRTCGMILRLGRGPVCRVRYATCKTCAEPFVQWRTNVYCSDNCRCAASPHIPRGTQRTRSCKGCRRSFTFASGTRPPDYCSALCRRETTRRSESQRQYRREYKRRRRAQGVEHDAA